MERILVPTDFSAPARHATDLAATLAGKAGATVDLFHAVDVPDGYVEAHFVTAANANRSPREQQALYPEARRRVGRARQRLAEVGRKLDACKVANTNTVGFNLAWKDIAHLAEERRADLIVMGTTGAGGVRRALLGSNTQKVVRLAAPPVLTLRSAAPKRIANVVLLADTHARDAADRLERLLPLVAGFGAKLHLLHVNTPARFEDTDTSLERLRKLEEALSGSCKVHVTDHYTVAEGAIAFARRAGMDLIGVSTHGRRGVRALLNASTAETIVEHADIPVLIDHLS